MKGKRIIIIHPEITEGLSLKGTETFHILEPIANASLLKQITGRAIGLNHILIFQKKEDM